MEFQWGYKWKNNPLLLSHYSACGMFQLWWFSHNKHKVNCFSRCECTFLLHWPSLVNRNLGSFVNVEQRKGGKWGYTIVGGRLGVCSCSWSSNVFQSQVMNSISAFDGQMVSLQRVYGLYLQVSTLPSNGWLCKFNLCSLLISAVLGLFGLRSCLGDRANC